MCAIHVEVTLTHQDLDSVYGIKRQLVGILSNANISQSANKLTVQIERADSEDKPGRSCISITTTTDEVTSNLLINDCSLIAKSNGLDIYFKVVTVSTTIPPIEVPTIGPGTENAKMVAIKVHNDIVLIRFPTDEGRRLDLLGTFGLDPRTLFVGFYSPSLNGSDNGHFVSNFLGNQSQTENGRIYQLVTTKDFETIMQTDSFKSALNTSVLVVTRHLTAVASDSGLYETNGNQRRDSATSRESGLQKYEIEKKFELEKYKQEKALELEKYKHEMELKEKNKLELEMYKLKLKHEIDLKKLELEGNQQANKHFVNFSSMRKRNWTL